uniref:Uncharacterized protein n=1 Tax=Anguilla anguilla TaxID=7936 RepID=A0A0E9USH6_ANGAN
MFKQTLQTFATSRLWSSDLKSSNQPLTVYVLHLFDTNYSKTSLYIFRGPSSEAGGTLLYMLGLLLLGVQAAKL